MILDFGIIAGVTKYYHYLVPVLPPLAIVIGVWLHPKLATVLLNDLFGIQSRAGCSCAGPYGHRLLDLETSEQYRDWVRQGYQGIKPGWCRVGFHYVMDDAEADYVIDAIDFLGRHGDRFIGLYDFDVHSGMWSHRGYEERADEFSLDSALRSMGSGGAAGIMACRDRAECPAMERRRRTLRPGRRGQAPRSSPDRRRGRTGTRQCGRSIAPIDRASCPADT